MEATASNSGSVHVLRHSFRPSEHLGDALSNYLETGVAHPRSFLYATRLITLNTDRHPAHEISIDYDKVNSEFVRHHHERVMFGREERATDNESKKIYVVAKRLGNGALRVGLMPTDTQHFTSLLSGFDGLPNDVEIPTGMKVRYYVHTDIPERSLRKDVDIEANTQRIADELDVIERARMFYAIPSAVDRLVIPATINTPDANRSK